MSSSLPLIDLLLHAVLAYLLGSLSGSLLLGRLRGVDIRSQGSGNAGGTNAFRTQGIKFAVLVVVIDIGKGVAATALLPKLALGLPQYEVSMLSGICAIGAVCGHIWPLFFGFRGGKGAATAVGAAGTLSLVAIPVLLAIWIVTIILTGYVGLASMLAALSLWPTFALWGPEPLPLGYHIAAIGLSLLVVYAHRSNIQRMLAGNENRFQKARLLHRWLKRSP
jgi:glycerol-3-phosphate acyltransferase PlsY